MASRSSWRRAWSRGSAGLRRGAASRRKHNRRECRLRVESLEPRLLLEAGPLVVTELNYAPFTPEPAEAGYSASDFEFIELKNLGTDPYDLSQVTISQAVTFSFAGSAVTSLEPGEHVVVVANQTAFALRYGSRVDLGQVLVAGQFSGKLANEGERVVVSDGPATLWDFTYGSTGPWPGRADEKGSTLVPLDPTGDLNDPDNWFSSREYGGSPGSDGLGLYADVVVNEVLTNPAPGAQDAIELYNAGTSDVDIAGWYLSDSSAQYRKYQIPSGDPTLDTLLTPGEFLVIDESRFNAPGDPNRFGMGAGGDDVWLLEADSGGTLLRFADHLEFGASPEGITLGRWPDGTGEVVLLSQPTLGDANSLPRAGDVVITELMYHPASELDTEEYIELYNRDLVPVHLAGWQFADGVDYAFPDVTVQPGEYLIVAADPAVFHASYNTPPGTQVVGGWTGSLRNSGETIELVDAFGERVDRVTYADEGDWGTRQLGPTHYGHRGWEWTAGHDGGGKSLELINLALSNNYGQNWAPSVPDGGTPGAANSVAATDIAPMILDVTHFPVIPQPADQVTVTARVVDELTTGVTVTLHYRLDQSTYSRTVYPPYAGAYVATAMLDDGLHGDGEAGDGVYGAAVDGTALRPGGLQDGDVVEFYVSAEDAGALSRTWPAPAMVDGSPEQVTNLLFQVDASFDPNHVWNPDDPPVFYLIMTNAELGRLDDIGAGGGDEFSDAQMNGTFISRPRQPLAWGHPDQHQQPLYLRPGGRQCAVPPGRDRGRGRNHDRGSGQRRRPRGLGQPDVRALCVCGGVGRRLG